MKDNNEVIAEFNDYVNMTASELEKWLKSDDSNSAGWTRDGDKNGESVGHDSGRQIVDILKSNPGKDADKYTDDQLQHMRKVAAYCKRHLAQEAAGNKKKDPEEVKETKSYISLKNWGHDFLKAQGKDSGSANGSAAKASPKKTQGGKDAEKQGGGDTQGDPEETGDDRKAEDIAEKENEASDVDVDAGPEEHEGEEMSEDDEDSHDKQEPKELQDAETDNNTRKTPVKKNGKADTGNDDSTHADGEYEDEKRAGDKRKKTGKQNDPKKKRDTGKTRSSTRKANQDEDTHNEEESEDDGDSGEASSKQGPQKGQTVSWNWGNGNPEGKVLDVKEEKYVLLQMIRIPTAFRY